MSRCERCREPIPGDLRLCRPCAEEEEDLAVLAEAETARALTDVVADEIETGLIWGWDRGLNTLLNRELVEETARELRLPFSPDLVRLVVDRVNGRISRSDPD